MKDVPSFYLRAALSRVLMLVLVIAASATIFGACGGSAAAPETPTATDTTPSPGETSMPVVSGGAWRTDLPIGASLGSVSRWTPVLLADGSMASLEELADGKPLLLYFYATWCAVCNAEFRTLTTLYPEFADEVALVAVGFGTSETVEKLNQHQESLGYPGLFTEGPSSMAVEFDVRTQSTKFMMTADGVIAFKKGYGLGSAEEWRERFQALIDG